MKIGLLAGADNATSSSINQLVAFARSAEQHGFDSFWMAHFIGLDAITALTVAARETDRIELGSAVIPSYPRHPVALAQQALTASAASDNRFTLGVGLSHKMLIEDMLGLDYSRPATHMRDYLSVLAPLLSAQAVDHSGELYSSHLSLAVQGVSKVPLLLAALGPAMLRIAGSMADGTITWMTGPKTMADHIVPSIRLAAEEANRGEPRVVCGLPVAITSDVDAAKEALAKELELYGQLPSYRAMLDREGAAGPADIALLGDEAELRSALQLLRDAGVTDLNAAVVDLGADTVQRTMEFLAAEN
jgi:F420-dependent oxidoreductase-like protein